MVSVTLLAVCCCCCCLLLCPLHGMARHSSTTHGWLSAAEPSELDQINSLFAGKCEIS